MDKAAINICEMYKFSYEQKYSFLLDEYLGIFKKLVLLYSLIWYVQFSGS
jgi:hypothetical protein